MTLQKFNFPHSLQVDGKLLPTNDLTKLLKNAHGQLKALEQDRTELSSIQTISRDLLLPKVIENRDKGVKCLAACCLADVLRVTAPEPPYSPQELLLILELFVKQFVFAADSENPYFPYALYLLQNLALVRSMALIGDVDEHDLLLIHAINTIFESTANPVIQSAVKSYFIEILYQMLDSIPQITFDHMELLLSQLSSNQFSKNVKDLVLAVLLKCQDRIHMNVAQYFSEIILPSQENLDILKLKRVHEVVVILNNHCEEVLLNVIPQIEAELKIENNDLRYIATDCLGKMFSTRGSLTAKKYINSWISWMIKRNDKCINIRLLWLDYAMKIIELRPERYGEMFDALKQKLLDPEEKVRKKVLNNIKKWAESKDVDTLESIPLNLLEEICARCWDKKPGVRTEAIYLLSRIYARVYQDLIISSTPTLSEKFGWIPGKLLELFNLKRNEITFEIIDVFSKFIIPKELPLKEKQRNLLYVYTCMNEKQKEIFSECFIKLEDLEKCLLTMMDFILSMNGKKLQELPDNVKKAFLYTKKMLPEDQELEITGFFNRFASVNQKMLFLVKKSVCDGLFPNELGSSSSDVMNILAPIVNRLYSILSAEMIPYLIDVNLGNIKDGSVNLQMQASSKLLLKSLVKNRANFIKININYIMSSINNFQEDCEVLLYLMNRVFILHPNLFENDLIINDTLLSLISKVGINWKVLKYSCNIFCLSKNCDISELIDLSKICRREINDGLDDFKTICHYLIVMKQLIRYQFIKVPKDDIEEIERFVKDRLLQNNIAAIPDDEDTWLNDDKISYEVFGLQLLNEIVIQNGNIASFESHCKFFIEILAKEGETSHYNSSSFAYRTRIRLTCALGLLKCLRIVEYERVFSDYDFLTVSLTVQDACYDVREAFIKKLMKYLQKFSVHVRYLCSLFFVAYEPEDALKNEVSAYLARMMNVMRTSKSSIIPENLFPRLIHLLAHHPDFSSENVDDAMIAVDFLKYYLQICLNNENASYLYQIGNEVKKTNDMMEPRNNNIYCIAELSQLLIQKRCLHHNWALTTYSGKIVLPSRLFKPITDVCLINENTRKKFVPSELVAMMNK